MGNNAAYATITRSGKYIATAGGGDRLAKLWDTKTRQCVHTFRDGGISNNMNWVEVTNDEQFIFMCTMDSKIVIFDMVTKQRVVALIEHGRGVKGLSIARDDRFMVTFGGDMVIFLMGCSQQNVETTLESHEGNVYDYQVSPSGNWGASGGMDVALHIWNLLTMKLHKKVKEHNDTINCVTWSPNEKFLASGGFDGNTMVYSVARDFEPIMSIPPIGWRTVYGVVFTADSSQLCLTADSTIRVFTIKHEIDDEVCEMKGHTK